MNKEDKNNHLTSTIVLGIFLTIIIVNFILFLRFGRLAIASAANSSDYNPDEGNDVGNTIYYGFQILILSFGVVFFFGIYIVSIVLSVICLLVSISNRHHALKPVRIISFVYDGLFALCIIYSIIRIVLFIAGVY